jgi:hypothetical protein
LVDVVQRTGRWTEENRALLQRLSDDDRRFVISQLVPAVNRGAVKVEVEGIPF